MNGWGRTTRRRRRRRRRRRKVLKCGTKRSYEAVRLHLLVIMMGPDDVFLITSDLYLVSD